MRYWSGFSQDRFARKESDLYRSKYHFGLISKVPADSLILQVAVSGRFLAFRAAMLIGLHQRPRLRDRRAFGQIFGRFHMLWALAGHDGSN